MNKKFLTTAVFALIISTGAAIAIQPTTVNEQKQINENTAQLINKNGGPGGAIFMDKLFKLFQKYDENLRTCVPAHFKQYIDIFGLKIHFDFDINGWVDNKCEYKISGNISEIGTDIREVFDVKVSDEKIAAIKPTIDCKFNETQLNTMIDALESHNKKSDELFEKMLANPEKQLKYTKEKRKLTHEEEKFLAMLMTENVCSIPDKEELMRQFSELTQPSQNP